MGLRDNKFDPGSSAYNPVEVDDSQDDYPNFETSSSSSAYKITSSAMEASSSELSYKSSSSSKKEESSSSVLSKNEYFNPDLGYGEFTDERDGQKYKTTVIDGHTWMAENLNYGDSIATPILSGNSWCYENLTENCQKYGRLYNWVAALDIDTVYMNEHFETEDSLNFRGICPSGFRLPTANDLHELFLYTQANCENYYTEVCLRTKVGWFETFLDSLGLDLFGLSVVPAGENFMMNQKTGEMQFRYQDKRAAFFSITDDGEFSSNRAYAIEVDMNHFHNMDILTRWKTTASSIRCIKIEE